MRYLKKWGMKLCIVSMSMLALTMKPVCAKAEEAKPVVEKEYSLNNDDLYDQYIEYLMSLEDGISLNEYNGDEGATHYNAATSKLTKYGKIVYEKLLDQVKLVANGERESTEFVIPYSEVYGENETFTFTASELGMSKITDQNVSEALTKITNVMVEDNTKEPGIGGVYDAVLTEAAYHLYWSTGIVNYSACPSIQHKSHTADSITVYPVKNESFMFKISVAKDYFKDGNEYKVNTAKTSTAKNAIDYAKVIVTQAQSMSDQEKLTYYKNAICGLVEYDYSASSTAQNPRQIVYVFDQDKSTNVVCEGYSKAFKYLCDLTKFSSSEIECRLATGYMVVDSDDPGPHMWNIIQLKKNENYLVDVTNCDDGSIGHPDILFMCSGSEKVTVNSGDTEFWGYRIAIPYSSIIYLYDNSSYIRMRNVDELILVTDSQTQQSEQQENESSKSDNSGTYRNLEWEIIDGKSYWYEDNVRQGTSSDTKCFSYEGTLRGREIYDPTSNGWYWLDVNADGAKAVGKEVFMPYIYQDQSGWNEDDINNNATASGADAEGNIEHAELADQVKKAIHDGTGKWVRYDNEGKMLKGWVTIEGDLAALYPNQAGNRYYYDRKTGLMAKGTTVIDGKEYYFDETTGVLK